MSFARWWTMRSRSTKAACKPIEIIVPEGSMLNPKRGAAVVAGNVETSQVIVDALYGALGKLAASQGTMNNFTFGDERYQYYETICGGSGAGPGFDGASAVQTHMTNSRLTDPEVLESRFPILVERFGVRRGIGRRRRTSWRRRRRARDTLPRADDGGDSREPARRQRLSASPAASAGKPARNHVRRADGRIVELAATAKTEVGAGRCVRHRNAGRRRIWKGRGLMLVLLGIAVVVFGFIVRANPLLVVMAAALTTGLAAAWTPEADLAMMWNAGVATLAQFGKAFNDSRYISLVWLVLAAIGLLERSGLQERARMLIAQIPAATDRARALGLFRDAADPVGAWPHLARRPRADGATAGCADGGGRRGSRGSARCPTASAISSARTRRPQTISGCSSARTSSSPSVRSC